MRYRSSLPGGWEGVWGLCCRSKPPTGPPSMTCRPSRLWLVTSDTQTIFKVCQFSPQSKIIDFFLIDPTFKNTIIFYSFQRLPCLLSNVELWTPGQKWNKKLRWYSDVLHVQGHLSNMKKQTLSKFCWCPHLWPPWSSLCRPDMRASPWTESPFWRRRARRCCRKRGRCSRSESPKPRSGCGDRTENVKTCTF